MLESKGLNAMPDPKLNVPDKTARRYQCMHKKSFFSQTKKEGKQTFRADANKRQDLTTRTRRKKQELRSERGMITGDVPRLALADVYLGDDLDLRLDTAGDLALKVVIHQLRIRRTESEPQGQRFNGDSIHFHRSLLSRHYSPTHYCLCSSIHQIGLYRQEEQEK